MSFGFLEQHRLLDERDENAAAKHAHFLVTIFSQQ